MKRYTRHDIKEMINIAKERGGLCLSKKYINANTKLEWQCPEGHIWETSPEHVIKGTWCPICGAKRGGKKNRLTIEDMQVAAEKRGGKCLSEKYYDAHTKLKWQCLEGHIWEAKPSNIINNNNWCPICVGRNKTIQDMQRIAKERGGKCLSDRYVNALTKLKWQCSEGHIWEASPMSLNKGSWCNKCVVNKKKLTIAEMKEIALQRGGKCLSDKYINIATKLSWECSNGHVWMATPKDIKDNCWCPFCSKKGQGAIITINELCGIAKERGGKCLSDKYSPGIKIKWQCSEGHIWETKVSNIKNNGSWCPQCSEGIGEKICRAHFENIFNSNFPKQRPLWLVNERNNKMELDGYCSDLKIAFEYNGKQHYDLVPIYHSGLIQTLQTRKRDDKFKVALCKKYGINLIVIPYSVKKDKIYDFIIKECKKRKIGIPEHKKDDYTKLNIYSANRFRLADMQLLALNHGGKCLSDKYIDIETKLKWQCSEGHVWELSPRRVKNGDWCIICNKKNRQRPPRDKTRWLNDVKEIAASRGGFCISDKYIGVMKKLKWKCAKGHVWETAPCTIKQGAWCPKCAGKQKHTIEEMHEIAKEHGGKCLSETYINSGTELTWQCAREHIWKATPKSVLISKSWCLECSGSKKLTIEAMQQIAKERDGKCLSTKYINAHTKLRWQCFKGHIWEAKPSDVKNGNNWCPSCANSRKGKKKRLAK